ncbi:MAG: 50S ribosomal protein L3 [Propionibacteriaceae bacterium]|jgi:large subunit ribosomal protein L3|nr:50S ribosomal protein L3 [Propionibacteriaceae bacterium]
MNQERKVKGLLGRKLGMTQLWDGNNKIIPVTVIEAGPCVVTQVRTPERDGYSAIQLGFGQIKAKAVTKPAQGHFAKANATPRRHMMEIRTPDASEYAPGDDVTAEIFADQEIVDVIGVTRGRGTAGVMKRHGFAGLGAGHGVHRKHRSPGSIGECSTPSRIFKGMRMAGHMGVQRQTVSNLVIVRVDSDRGLILVRGAIPGPKNGLVVVRSAAKKGA